MVWVCLWVCLSVASGAFGALPTPSLSQVQISARPPLTTSKQPINTYKQPINTSCQVQISARPPRRRRYHRLPTAPPGPHRHQTWRRWGRKLHHQSTPMSSSPGPRSRKLPPTQRGLAGRTAARTAARSRTVFAAMWLLLRIAGATPQ